MPPIPLSQLNLHIVVSPMFLFFIMALLIAGWGIFTLVIRYHWKNYGTGKLEVFTMNFFYFAGSVIFMALLVILALAYYFSADPVLS